GLRKKQRRLVIAGWLCVGRVGHLSQVFIRLADRAGSPGIRATSRDHSPGGGAGRRIRNPPKPTRFIGRKPKEISWNCSNSRPHAGPALRKRTKARGFGGRARQNCAD